MRNNLKISEGMKRYFSDPKNRKKHSLMAIKFGFRPPSRKGIKLTEVHKRNLSIALKGKIRKEKVGYRAIHYWMESNFGKPTKCEHCGADGLTGKQINWANVSGHYLRDRNDWIRICGKCHRKFDARELKAQYAQ